MLLLTIQYFTVRFLCRVRSAEISVTMYRRKTVVGLKYMDDMPVFDEIVEIFVTPIGECLFVMKILATLCFCSHLHSYEVGLTNCNNVYVARQYEFLDHYPLHKIKIDNKCFIRLTQVQHRCN